MNLDILQNLKTEITNAIMNVSDISDLEVSKQHYIGKKGVLNKLFKEMISAIEPEERKEVGQQINLLKNYATDLIESKEIDLNKKGPQTHIDSFEKTLPGNKPEIGHLNIVTTAIREIVDIFKPLGFSRVRYPEVDWEKYAFEDLNMPETHPARDEWETFFVDLPTDEEKGRVVITPHTSNGQIRDMLRGEVPIRMLNISRCGRRQSDLNHNTTFFQFEGLVVDKGINITHLKGVLNYFAKNFFGPDREIRLRPYDFRFTEPSFEIDVNCGLCLGKGCKMCKAGWLELGGAGMVHPSVLKAGGLDSTKYSGFAFGWGVERTYMMKSGTKIDDIRHLIGNDLRFLEQF